jgi:hypothetical protein
VFDLDVDARIGVSVIVAAMVAFARRDHRHEARSRATSEQRYLSVFLISCISKSVVDQLSPYQKRIREDISRLSELQERLPCTTPNQAARWWGSETFA